MPFVEGGTEEWWWQVSGEDTGIQTRQSQVSQDSIVGVVKRLKLKAVEYDPISGRSKRDCPLDNVQTDMAAKSISSSVHAGCSLRDNAAVT